MRYFIFSGKNIVVKSDTVFVDRERVKEGFNGDVKITFTGDLVSLDCTQAVNYGNVNEDIDAITVKIKNNSMS